jgi:hypothetical protein
MTKNTPRMLAALAMGSLTLAFGGCLGTGVWQTVISDVAMDGAFDLFLNEGAVPDLAAIVFETDPHGPKPVREDLGPALDLFGS